jgi:hypothetical protein
MQARIVDLIGKVSHDELTAELLRLNDELNNLFLRQARYEKNRDPKTATTAAKPSEILGAAIGKMLKCPFSVKLVIKLISIQECQRKKIR